MDKKFVSQIRSYVKFSLFPRLHSRHLDDCTQYILMKIWENQQRGVNRCLRRLFIDYLRSVGLTNRGNMSSRALEEAMEYDLNRSVDYWGNEVWDKDQGNHNGLF